MAPRIHAYTSTLTNGKGKKGISADDIALLYEEQVPCSKLQVGRVVEVYLETHGRVRKVEVITKNTLLRRPVTKLCRVQW